MLQRFASINQSLDVQKCWVSISSWVCKCQKQMWSSISFIFKADYELPFQEIANFMVKPLIQLPGDGAAQESCTSIHYQHLSDGFMSWLFFSPAVFTRCYIYISQFLSKVFWYEIPAFPVFPSLYIYIYPMCFYYIFEVGFTRFSQGDWRIGAKQVSQLGSEDAPAPVSWTERTIFCNMQ